ncbi:hypothetical protein ACHAPU_000762 [Fusarium lateritium]
MALNLAKSQYKDEAAILPLIDAGNIVYLPRSDTKFASEQLPDVLSMHKSAERDLQTDYTTMDPSLTHDPIHLELITTKLTKEVGNLIPSLAEEIEHCFNKHWGRDLDWKEVCVFESMQKMISGVANLMFVGFPMCRNDEMLRLGVAFAQDIPLSSAIIKAFPSFVKPIVAPLITLPNRIHTRKFEKILKPEIETRLKEYETHKHRANGSSKGHDSERNDFLEWSIHQAKEIGNPKNWQVSALSERILLLNFAAIHTTTFAATHALLDIASSTPEFVAELRDEVETVLQQHDNQWNKRAVAQLEKLDSAIRESQRKNSIVGVGVV